MSSRPCRTAHAPSRTGPGRNAHPAGPASLPPRPAAQPDTTSGTARNHARLPRTYGPRRSALQEVEEVFHPLRARRRARRRGIRAHMPGSVELIYRISQADPEYRLDLRRLARDQERVEALERLHVAPAGRGRQPLRREPGDNPVNVLPGDLPRRAAASSQEPLQGARGVADGHLAETTCHLGDLKSPQALLLEGNRIRCRARAPQRRPPRPAGPAVRFEPRNLPPP